MVKQKKNKKNKKNNIIEEEYKNEIDCESDEIDIEKNKLEKKLDNFSMAISSNNNNDNDNNIIIKNFSLGAYGKELFINTDLSIIKGKKYALLGPNGQGKSTLLIHLYSKKLPVPKNLDIFMVEQEIESSHKSVITMVLESNNYLNKLQKKLDKFDKYNKDLTEDELKEYSTISEELNKYNSSYLESKAKKILNGLGFSPEMQEQSTSTFSGGWRMRISIAKALFMEPEILLLDEPTNHLDLNTVIWLEDYLKKWKKTLLIVSHNQDFIDEVCTDIISINNKKIKQYNCSYTNFIKMSEQIKESEIKEWGKYQKKIKDLKKTTSNKKAQEIADKQEKNKKNKKNKNYSNDLSSVEKIDLDKIIKPKDYYVKFSFPPPSDIGFPLIDLKNISFAYDNSDNLFENLSIGIGNNERICIIGPNGIGKSTLIKIMCNELHPTIGEAYINRKLRIGKYSQHFVDIIPNNISPVEFLQQIDSNLSVQEARKCLGSFGLESHAHIINNKNLSGGQKARVQFAMINIYKPHIIFLDEPTNHLDIESINALIKAINEYNGTIVIISHDTRLIEDTDCILYLCDEKNCKPFNGELNDYKNSIINNITEEKEVIKKKISIFDLL